MILHRPIIVGIFTVLFFLFPFSVFAAVTISLINVPTSIEQSEEKSIDILFSCPGCSSDSYLRGVFYPSGTSYFGYTQNNDGSWVNASGSNCTQYFKLVPSDLSEGTWSGTLKVKIDISSPYFNGPGEYMFKIGRYTPSCGSPTWSEEKTLQVRGPTATPSPSSTPVPSHTPSVGPTTTRTPTPTASGKPTPTLTLKITPTTTIEPTKPVESANNSEIVGNVLGVQDQNYASTSAVKKNSSQQILITSLLLMSVGTAMIALVLIYKKKFQV